MLVMYMMIRAAVATFFTIGVLPNIRPESEGRRSLLLINLELKERGVTGSYVVAVTDVLADLATIHITILCQQYT